MFENLKFGEKIEIRIFSLDPDPYNKSCGSASLARGKGVCTMQYECMVSNKSDDIVPFTFARARLFITIKSENLKDLSHKL